MIFRFINKYLREFDIEVIGDNPTEYKYMLYYKYIWGHKFHKFSNKVYDTQEEIMNIIDSYIN